MRRTHGSVLLLLIAAVLFVIPIRAQSLLDGHYSSSDGTFEISYPADWTVDDNDAAFIVLIGRAGGQEIAMTVFSTETIAIFSLGADSALDVAKSVAGVIDFVQDDAQPYPIAGRDVAIASVDLDGQVGAAFALQMANGEYGMVIVLTDLEVLQEQADLLLTIVNSYNTPGIPTDSDTPAFLKDYDGLWQDAIADLERLSLIGSGGSLVFQESNAFFDGVGSWFTPLAQSRAAADVVVGATMAFTTDSDEPETCGLMARIESSDGTSVNIFLEVGLDSDGNLYYLDRYGADSASTTYRAAPLNLNLDEPHHILFIAIDDTLTIYLDGQLVFDHVAVDNRSGFYGLTLVGHGINSRCEGNNIWAYEAPSFEEGVCEISPVGTVNKRTGPGTNFDRGGTVSFGTVTRAIGQASGDDGFRWWKLEDNTWVREDVVSATGDCSNLPESE